MINKTILEIKTKEWIVFEYDILDSTNEELKRRVVAKEAKHDTKYDKGIIVVSNEQTKGKGCYDKCWISPLNSGLYASWLFHSGNKVNLSLSLQLFSLLLGLCCVETLIEFINSKPFIKWPNDVVVGGKKIGGILIEIYQYSYIIAGIGINLFPNSLFPACATSLCEHSTNLALNFKDLRDKVLNTLSCKLNDSFKLFGEKGASFVLDKVTSYLSTPPGSSVQFIKDNQPFRAVVLGLSQNGELIVELENKKIIMLSSREVNLKADYK